MVFGFALATPRQEANLNKQHKQRTTAFYDAAHHQDDPYYRLHSLAALAASLGFSHGPAAALAAVSASACVCAPFYGPLHHRSHLFSACSAFVLNCCVYDPAPMAGNLRVLTWIAFTCARN